MINDTPHFTTQPVLSDLYQSKDLLDFSGPSTPPRASTSSPSASPSTTSLFSSATSIASAATRRAAAAGLTSSPSDPSSSSTAKEVRCVEGYGQNLYIGNSDGTVEWWICEAASAGNGMNGWGMKHRHTLFPRRPVNRVYILPKISKILMISDGTLHALSLPNLEPLPSSHVPPLRGVVSVILDDEELEWGGPGSEDPNAQMTVVVVRRKGLGVYKLGNRMNSVKEIPLPSSPTHHALFSSFLCAAITSGQEDTQQTLYSIIDLSDASLTEVLPVSQIDPAVAEFEPNPNIVVIPGENEFLVTSYTGSSTMGVFLNGQGDPVRGTMEWPSHPISIAVESEYIIALLRDQTITIHSLADLEKPTQVISLDPSLNAVSLTYSPYGISVRDIFRDERLVPYKLKLLGGKLAPKKPTEEPKEALPQVEDLPNDPLPVEEPLSPEVISPVNEDPPSGSGLTPPSSPKPHHRHPTTLQNATSSTSTIGPFSTAVSETLIVCPHSIVSLLPTSTIMKLQSLCSERQFDEAISLVDDERRRGRRGEIDVDKATHHNTMKFLHLYLALHLFEEALFDKALDYFTRSKVDPRILVRCFGGLRGKLIGSEEGVEVYEGVREVLERMGGVEDIISTSLKRNYSPHVQPNTATAPETSVLRLAMMEEAKDMLTEFLRKTRASRRKGGGARGVDSRKIDIVIDSTLAKLLADKGTTNELLALLAAPNDCVSSELEPFLAQTPYVLATVMRTQGRVDRVLELLKDIAESDTPDPICEDPVEELAQQLESIKDPEVFLEYALWLVKKKPSRGLSILMAQNTKNGIKLDDLSLVKQLGDIDRDTANRYLEFAVVTKKSPSRALHEQLLGVLLDEVEELCRDEGVKYHLEELDAEYRLEPSPRPFITFLADIAPDTPIKRNRLKLMLFLQGSPFFDLEGAAKRLDGVGELKFELAVVYGRLLRHRQSLSLLAITIGDSISAQTYCQTKGEIIPPKISKAVAKQVRGLDPWASLIEVGRKKSQGQVKEDEMRGLVRELLGVYMSDSKGTSKQAAALLNAQSVHLDVLEVLGQMPNDWPLDEVSSFLKRSFRRGLHERSTWGVLKAISAGQNMEVSEEYLDRIRRIPPIIRTSSTDGHDDNGLTPPDEGSIPETEWGTFEEKSMVEGVLGEKDGVIRRIEGEVGSKEGYIVDREDGEEGLV
ncbi:hypothetical protein I302_105801 [Kwoniella bestiolae CBS 10118]|uniref:CNH domain-containing protein n=1 Tax=Kwoniella bestiolae CBS 10118 TaxID=1296100 RepID=A0A1B9G253_9TREE|nr:hypothetical protein I302_04922 [Kwoniella bestiolae CBS 10118]OCF25112.1 hypothetical protein I302_04922 [Kwoniella bestiolae CBS 10118]